MSADSTKPISTDLARLSGTLPLPGVQGGAVARTESSGSGESDAAAQESGRASISADDLSRAVSQLNDLVQGYRSELEFRVDDEIGVTVIRVVNSDTKELIRQIPAEEIVRLLRNMRSLEEDKGMILREII